LSEENPASEEKPTGAEKPPVTPVEPETKPAPEPEPAEPIITEEKEEETAKHKVALRKTHKCPRCGEETVPCKIKTDKGEINARACVRCGKAYT